MASKTIKISEENYKMLLGIMADLQQKNGERASFDDAIDNLTSEEKRNGWTVMESAGAWNDMTDEEAKEFLDSTYKERKIKSRRLD
ncbi:MAG: antitoxin VapB family protein [Nanoarchaeota archaeon]